MPIYLVSASRASRIRLLAQQCISSTIHQVICGKNSEIIFMTSFYDIFFDIVLMTSWLRTSFYDIFYDVLMTSWLLTSFYDSFYDMLMTSWLRHNSVLSTTYCYRTRGLPGICRLLPCGTKHTRYPRMLISRYRPGLPSCHSITATPSSQRSVGGLQAAPPWQQAPLIRTINDITHTFSVSTP